MHRPILSCNVRSRNVKIVPTPLTPPCEELDPQYDIKLVSAPKITVFLRKMINKNCCHQSCTF